MNQEDESIGGQEQRPKTKDIDVVNLNTATAEELSRLPGIKAKLAGRIVEYRTKVHPFRETAEITEVRGISAALYEGIADLLTVGPAEPVPWIEPEASPLPAEPEEAALPSEPEMPAAPIEVEAPMPAAEPEAPVRLVEPEVPEVAQSADAPRFHPVVVREVPPPPPTSTPAPRPRPAPEPRRGIGWPALLAACLASAIAGACLALVLLLAINGTLRFGPNATVSELGTQARQLNLQAERSAASLSQMQSRLDEIDRRLATAQAHVDAVGQEMTRMGGDAQALQGRLEAIESQFGGLAQDLQAARQAARRLDAFLSGLRGLLDQTQGPALGVTPLPQAPSATRKPGLTVVPQPTATPRS
jgi:competence ComEA-like helix-hairpin-helix protein